MKKFMITILVMVVFSIVFDSGKTLNATTTHKTKSYSFNLNYKDAVAPGIKEVSPSVFQLDTKYKQPHQYLVYYGELQYSGITDYSMYDFIVVFDRNVESVTKARKQGTKIFQYLYFGSRFKDTDAFIQETKATIKTLKDQGLADGIFLDECDIAYWNVAYQNDPEKQRRFYERLKEITEYIRSLGMESVVNGTRSFVGLGDYFMWESFLSSWNSNRIQWDNKSPITPSVSNESVTYGRRFSDWTFEGTTHEENGKVVGGEKGAMEIVLDLDQFLQNRDIREKYDWVYTEWFGTGGTDKTISIYAWTGDALPFNTSTWKKLPKLWKGEANSWNGIGSNSKYIKLRYEFNGASNLNMEQILLTFDYTYSYWKMNQSNGAADTNPYMWNYNNKQLSDIQNEIKNSQSNSPIKILTQSYGDHLDQDKIRYTFLGSAINDFYAWNYAQPMQTAIYYDVLEEPIGMLLKRETVGNVLKGYFTGATASIDTTTNTYNITRNEPSYYYNRAIKIDGDMTDWLNSDQIYNKTGPEFASGIQFWGANKTTYSTGTFDNVQVVTRNGNAVLELVKDGVGTWISKEQGMDPYNYKKQLSELTWNGGNGSVNYYIQFQKADGSWTDWIQQKQGTSYPLTDFYKFRVKVKLQGAASKQVIDSKTKQTQFVQGASFWGSSHIWKVYLNDDVNVTGIWMTDDSKYLYIRVRTKGQLDFSTNDNILSKYFYSIYLDTVPESTNGFKGSWWNTPNTSAKYRITNNALYKWKQNYSDTHSNDGWEWIGTTNIGYKLNTTKNEIEYRIKKSDLGDLTSKNLKLYMTAEETSTSYGNFVRPDFLKDTTFTGEMNYSQKSYLPYVPHGYIQSEIIEAGEGRNASLTWNGTAPNSTSTKAWIRTRTPGNSAWNNWIEVTNGQMISNNFDRIQYSIGLYTNDGKITPQISNIKLSFEETIKDSK